MCVLLLSGLHQYSKVIPVHNHYNPNIYTETTFIALLHATATLNNSGQGYICIVLLLKY